MAKKAAQNRRRATPSPPPPQRALLLGLILHLWRIIRRNPITSFASIIAIVVGLSTLGVAGYLEPAVPVWRAYLREVLDPIIKVQNTQGVGIDRYLLFQTHPKASVV